MLNGLEPNFRIVGAYTNSKLCWSISVKPHGNIKSESDLRGKRIGISRYGSGSHIMAIVLALQQGWVDAEQLPFEFVLLNDFKSLREGVTSGQIDTFLWEIATTKVIVSNSSHGTTTRHSKWSVPLAHLGQRSSSVATTPYLPIRLLLFRAI
jgi:ABC-type nitrate/sulfonate/bicarbonate transport system substrate-binding protein